MSLGPYASFIVTSYAAAALVVAILIGWVMLDTRARTQQFGERGEPGLTRRSGRSATELR
jgi:heme exporter protein D